MKKEIPLRPGFKAIAAAALISLFGLTNAQAQVKGASVSSSETVKATVMSVNQKTREVTIKTDDGQVHSFIAGDQVKNLAQVKKGDIITAVYTEEVAYEVLAHNKAAGAQSTAAVASAKPGAMPAGAVAQQVTVTVQITAIDPSVPSVTFKGPEGNTKTIKVKDPQKLVGVKVGDMVDITYTESLAVKVDKGPKK
jgi:ribosomal 50S subunit-recycling heat shock protein